MALAGSAAARLFASGEVGGGGPQEALLAFGAFPHMAGLLFAFWLWLWLRGHYTRRLAFITEFGEVTGVAATLAFLDSYLGSMSGGLTSAGALQSMALWALVIVLVLCARVVVKEILARLRLWQCPALLVGSGPGIAETRALLQGNPYLGYTVAATVDAGDPGFGARLRDCASSFGARCVFVVLDPHDIATNVEFVSLIEDEIRLPVSVMIDARGLLPGSVEVQRFVGSEMLVLSSKQRLWMRDAQLVKRLFDIVVSGLILLLLSPLLLVVAALVRRDGGSALYGSPRLGRGGKEFKALKFRSMVPNAEAALRDLLARDPAAREEWATRFKLENDPRVTRIGQFLRRSSIDELPQLVNVLRGEMSLVGPRPLLLEERARYGEPAFSLYCRAAPGLTGIWQVSGRDHLDYSDRIRMNNWYVRNWSPWLDFVILLKTAVVVTRQVGSS